MALLQRWLLAFLLAVSALPALEARAQPAPAATIGADAPAQAGAARNRWWEDHRWRYRSDEEAEAAYRALAASDTPSPWPEWHESNIVALPVGLRFQMALAPGQPSDRPGAFGTLDPIPSVEFVRLSLAVKTAWKPAIDRVVTYEVTAPLLADVGTVGPQIDVAFDRYLPGGASQFQMLVPAAERMGHLRIVEERPIR